MCMSEEVIETMVAAMGPEATERDRHLYREALLALVRLARAEQLVSLQQDFRTVEIATSVNYRRSA